MSWVRATVWGAVLSAILLGAWATRLATRWPTTYYMTGPSMEPTVSAGEFFLAWSPPGDLAAGDLVIFRYVDEDGEFHVLRRLAGLAGDTVAMERGVAILNGRRQPWPFSLGGGDAWRSELAIEGQLLEFGPWVVPPDSVLVLADRRDMLGWPDSRFLGFIPRSEVLARAEMTLSGRRLR